MNFLISLLVIIGVSPEGHEHPKDSPCRLLQKIHPEKVPQIFYCTGKTLTTLSTVFVPNVDRDSFQFFVKSPCELKQASVDSFDIPMCPVDEETMRDMHLRGRWYLISWKSELRPGSKKHTIFFTARSGLVFKNTFILNVEGTKRLYKPHGEDK